MTRVTLSGECGNSPKNAFAEAIAVALLTGDTAVLGDALADECSATLPGATKVVGRDAAVAAVTRIVGNPKSLRVDHAITHGRVGAVNGSFVSEKRETGFAFTLEFKNTKADSVAALSLYLA